MELSRQVGETVERTNDVIYRRPTHHDHKSPSIAIYHPKLSHIISFHVINTWSRPHIVDGPKTGLPQPQPSHVTAAKCLRTEAEHPNLPHPRKVRGG